ncbi:MAG: DMT family transporter, partial [Bacteroidales bacterium]|nr:DMT family transporter [Bacteroidales bacterium]
MVGEIMAIGVAAMWASSALFFDFANRKLLPINTNFIRMVFAFIPISLLLYIVSGNLFLSHTNLETWLWIGASGFVGFVFGDYFLFASYKEIHATYTQLIM